METNTNLDGGSGGGTNHNDHFASMKFSFSSLATAVNRLALPWVGTFDQNSRLQYIVATSNQKNALNQDLNGISGGSSSTTSFSSPGLFTPVFSANGTPATVPEPPCTMIMLGLDAAGRSKVKFPLMPHTARLLISAETPIGTTQTLRRKWSGRPDSN